MFFLYTALLLAITTFIIVVPTSQLNWKARLCRMFMQKCNFLIHNYPVMQPSSFTRKARLQSSSVTDRVMGMSSQV